MIRTLLKSSYRWVAVSSSSFFIAASPSHRCGRSVFCILKNRLCGERIPVQRQPNVQSVVTFVYGISVNDSTFALPSCKSGPGSIVHSAESCHTLTEDARISELSRRLIVRANMLRVESSSCISDRWSLTELVRLGRLFLVSSSIAHSILGYALPTFLRRCQAALKSDSKAKNRGA